MTDEMVAQIRMWAFEQVVDRDVLASKNEQISDANWLTNWVMSGENPASDGDVPTRRPHPGSDGWMVVR
jgi:hypothetical protein